MKKRKRKVIGFIGLIIITIIIAFIIIFRKSVVQKYDFNSEINQNAASGENENVGVEIIGRQEIFRIVASKNYSNYWINSPVIFYVEQAPTMGEIPDANGNLYPFRSSGWSISETSGNYIEEDGNRIIVSENGEYYIELYGTWTCRYPNEKGNIITERTTGGEKFFITVNCIDTLEPNIDIKQETTTNSININVNASDDKSGIGKIEMYYKNVNDKSVDYNIFYNSKNNYDVTGPLEVSANGEIKNLKTGKYNIVIRVYDIAGNIATKETEVEIPEVPQFNGKVKLDKEGWTNQNVTLTVESNFSDHNDNKFFTQISKDNQNWETANSIQITENGKVYIRLSDGVNVGKSTEIPITNIEKIPPTITFEPNGGNFTIKENESIELKTKIVCEDTGGSGINKIEYAWTKSNAAEPSTWNVLKNTEDEVSKTNITDTGTWCLWVKAVDNAGNMKTEVSKEFFINKEEAKYKGVVNYNYSENGGTFASKEIDNKIEGEQIDLSVSANKKDYEFIGWNTNKDATTGLTSLEMPKNDVTLYAIFKKNVKVKFTDYKGTTTNIVTLYNKQTQGDTIAPQISEYKSWKAEYWTKGEDANSKKDADEGEKITNIINDVTYYAMYSKSVTIKFDFNGGISDTKLEDIISKQRVNSKNIYEETGEEITIPSIQATKENDIPMSWNTKPNGTGIDYMENEIIKPKEDMTLYIKWKVKQNEDDNIVIKPNIIIENQEEWTSNNITIKISENSGGIKSLKINGELVQGTENEYKFDVQENGTYIIEIEDNKGNVIKKEIKIDNIDKIKPEIEINNTNEKIIKFSVKDLESGIKRLEFSYDKNTWNDCLDNNIEKEFTVTDGTYQVGTSEISIQLLNTLKNNLYFRAIDNAGNISDTKEIKAQNSEVKNNEIKNNNGNDNNDNKTDDEQINSNNKDTKDEIDNTKATKILPKAGEKRGIILILASLIIVMIFSIKKYKNLKEIK